MAAFTPFVSNPIRNALLNRPDSTIDLAKAMRDRKIVLFNLNKGVLQDIELQVLGRDCDEILLGGVGPQRADPVEQRPHFISMWTN